MEECKAFRMIAARLNYMAQDNPWLQFPAKEVCRNMAKPRASDFMKTKRLVRFLKGAGEIKFLYAWQNEDEACDITVLVDCDWAGNTETRKSTSGGVLKVGKHVIRTWSPSQFPQSVHWSDSRWKAAWQQEEVQKEDSSIVVMLQEQFFISELFSRTFRTQSY